MDIMTEISIKIAEATVPDEVDLAPIMTDAFVQGGKEKKDLFIKQEDTELGAFGPFGGIVLFPWILQGIAAAAPFILQVLREEQLEKYLSVINGFLGVCEKLKRKESTNQLPDHLSAPLNKVLDTFSSELKASGLPEEQCERVISNVLLTLIKDPSGSFVFVEKVAGSV